MAQIIMRVWAFDGSLGIVPNLHLGLLSILISFLFEAKRRRYIRGQLSREMNFVVSRGKACNHFTHWLRVTNEFITVFEALTALNPPVCFVSFFVFTICFLFCPIASESILETTLNLELYFLNPADWTVHSNVYLPFYLVSRLIPRLV